MYCKKAAVHLLVSCHAMPADTASTQRALPPAVVLPSPFGMLLLDLDLWPLSPLDLELVDIADPHTPAAITTALTRPWAHAIRPAAIARQGKAAAASAVCR